MKELQFLKENYQINTIIVEDDLFGFHKPSFYDLCDRIKKSQLNLRFNFPNALSVAILDEAMIDRLIEIGMESAILAIESGSPHVQKYLIKKNCPLPKALRLSKYIRNKGIPVMAYFILGFPRESVAMMEMTIEFAKKMELDWAYFLLACPLMGSEMCNELMESGILDEKKMLEVMNNTDFTKRLYDTPEISAKNLEALAYDANIDVNFLNNYNMLHGDYDRAIHKFSNVIRNYPFHIVALACRARCYHEKGDAEDAKRDLYRIDEMVQTHEESKRLYGLYGEKIDRLITSVPH